MGIAYTEVNSGTQATLQARIKECILKSSDWAHLQLSTGTQNTTLSAQANAGAVSISTAATIPSGSLVVIGNGAANPECRITTGVSGSGPYTVTFADALVATYSNASAVGVGFYCKATTTRGAQMVIDLNDAAISTQRMVIGVYRTHDGTTAGTKITRYLYYKWQSGATTESVYINVSASKESLFIRTEGPRAGETNADNSSYGSSGNCFAMCDIVPYFGGDTTPAVACIGMKSDSVSDVSPLIAVSRNQTDTSSWVDAMLLSLQTPDIGLSAAQAGAQPQLLAKGDGNIYLFPYVVVEQAHGLRGRLSDFFYGGAGRANISSDLGGIAFGTEVTYNSKTYKMTMPIRHRADAASQSSWTPFGFIANESGINASTRTANVAVLKA